MRAVIITVIFTLILSTVLFAAPRKSEPEYKMGYYYYNVAVENYDFGNFKLAIDNYRLASSAFLNEGNDFMQKKSDEGLTKSRILIQGN